ncbi:hydrogenase formation protein HypD [Desulfoprunum benzoelyticum]|uniref:Hydrogenase expression/formation protein HypD n=1 Tax=Desulfoprunum benzoelyticum TaxID=1506996 RepID=A0A840UQP4_9BACT|nr:hydrogenase formation protein HypD [Desulfoprunum benzoelyticum]MBB5348112.1 hydrogenase expression/formation protein HypD [Desulfoprunum benzoelyticum]MBM9530277.1 hydrogenase formation protein HypD [Desulfoprunum benzoelyticum]
MKYYDEYRDGASARALVAELRKVVTRPMRIMEVCGSHTMAIFRNGIRSILPDGLELISGPGCPVCVTSASHMDAFIAMADRPGVRVAIFGDLFRVPGSRGSLANASSRGAKVDIVYSPIDALDLAARHPQDLVVFLGVGFETTTPTIAATILAARNRNISNFAVFATQKTVPPALTVLLEDPELQLNGLLCPGHVSAIIGAGAYIPFAEKYHIACVVAGFETTDLLTSLIMLAQQIGAGEARVENAYARAVSWEGNTRAQQMVAEIFEPCDTQWRGLGLIPGSGLKIREKYRDFDAEVRLHVTLPPADEPKGCRCGDILKGISNPRQCPLFGNRCTPASPVGPCMVSSEGTCAAFHKYGLEV